MKYATDYEHVAASQAAQVLGGAGAAGDLLMRLIVNAITPATATVSIKDGADGAVQVCPPTTNAGPFVIEINARSRTGAWQITTGAGCNVMAVGSFT